MATRVFWCKTDRKLPSLNRGWRTPDPSPTRDAAGLPGYALTLCVETSSDQRDASELSMPTPRGCLMATSTRSTSRTPSPYLTHPPLCTQQICDKRVVDDKSVDRDMPTPRMLDSGPSFNGFSTQATKANSDVEPIQKKAPQVTSSKRDQGTKEQKPDAGGEHCIVVSTGTVGHPQTCAGACKFIMKKNRGCKDGAACNRCHLCEWKKRGPRKTKEVKDAPSTSPDAPSAQPEQSDQE
mmetsp:Transcript_90225/g.165220  ORF Transcript_90225/g.165220 Transcript_90225/m.165220 type:complete len:238 (+) Transcript_90225:87-800(+)